MAKTSIQKKLDNLLVLMEKLARGEELYPQNTRILQELEVDERTLRRYLEDIHTKYSNVVVTEKKRMERGGRRVTVYRVADKEKDVSEIFRFFIESAEDLGWLLQLIHENDPSLLKGYSKEAQKSMERILKEEEEVFQFVGSPFENLEEGRLKEIFKNLRRAVKLHEYRTIEYRRKEPETLEDLKCLKLMHMNDNWYLAAETKEGRLRLLRLAFIQKVKYSKKSNYRPRVLEKYAGFFTKVQNAMTLDKPFHTARLLASPEVAIYFDEGMKPFFPTQEFNRKNEDGSIEFTVQYTQPMEILPFVKHWLPDLRILEPESLAEKLEGSLKEYLSLSNIGKKATN